MPRIDSRVADELELVSHRIPRRSQPLEIGRKGGVLLTQFRDSSDGIKDRIEYGIIVLLESEVVVLPNPANTSLILVNATDNGSDA